MITYYLDGTFIGGKNNGRKIIDLPGFKGYKISNYGYVISYKRKEPKILTNSKYSNGYVFVTLSKNNESRTYLLHRLVLMAFCPCEGMENLQVNHKDFDRSNNRLDNLEWTTPQENRDYRDKNKHTPKAETIKVIFLEDGRELIFDTISSCAEYFGVSRKAINRYLETDNVRKDRKVQAIFRRMGRTSELN